ncbi:MAG: CpaB family protein [Candidatus Dormibacteria bacterium]
MRSKLAVAVGFAIFCIALAGFVMMGFAAQTGQVRVLAAARTIIAGQLLEANSSDLGPAGDLVHLGRAALADTFPQQDYRAVQGAVALVTIPAGSVILRQDLALSSGAGMRQVAIDLASMPAGVGAGDRVDLLSVWGDQTGAIGPGSNLCGGAAAVGCVVPLAQSVLVVAASQPAHSITITVPPEQVAPWLLLDATEPIWAVPAGAVACPGAEQEISNPAAALQAIQAPGKAPVCQRSPGPGTGGP